MPYAELDDAVAYLDQLQDAPVDSPDLATLRSCLERADAIIDLHLNAPATLTAAAPTTRTLYGDGSIYLTPDIPLSAVTSVTAPTGYTVPPYILQKGRLRITDSNGYLMPPYYPGYGYGYNPFLTFGPTVGWATGIPYTVAGTFGYDSTVMKALEEACLQIAIRLYRFKDSGGAEVLGAGEAAVTVKSDWSPMVQKILDAVNRESSSDAIGVW